MKIGLIGEAGSVATSLIDSGLALVARPTSDSARTVFAAAEATVIDDYAAFWDHLEHPRLFVLDMPIGGTIDQIIDEAYQVMEPGDVVVDPTGSYWCDTLRRYRRMRHRAIYYVDAGWIERDGSWHVMLAGDDKGVAIATPAMQYWAGEGEVLHVGGAGLAHFSVMVEEARVQAIAQIDNEAAHMIEAWPSTADTALTSRLWPLLDDTRLGRAAWQVDDALRLEAATPLLAQAAMLALADALEDQQSRPPPTRVGPFQHPDEIL